MHSQKLFMKEGPYIVNIPAGVPHSFQNLDDQVAELVVIFPTNVREYDVLDVFPFTTPEAKAMAADAKRGTASPRLGRFDPDLPGLRARFRGAGGSSHGSTPGPGLPVRLQ